MLRRGQVAVQVRARANELRPAVDVRHVSADFRATGNHDPVVRIHRLHHRSRDRLSDSVEANLLVKRDPKRTSCGDNQIDRGLIGLSGDGLSTSSSQQAAEADGKESRTHEGTPRE
jgi:hypothetical protein